MSVRPASHDVTGWQYSLFDSFGGGVFVPWYSRGGAYVLTATGGHNSPENTGAAIFDFETGQWSYLREQNGAPPRSSPYGVADTNGAPEFELAVTGVTPNAVPSPPHSYMNAIALAPNLGGGSKGSVVFPIQAAQCSESVLSTRSHRLDLATMMWSRYTSNRLDQVGTSLGVGFEAPSVFDSGSNRIWQLPTQIHSPQRIGFIDTTQSSPAWAVTVSWPYPPTWEGTASAFVDVTRRLILLQSTARLVAIDLNNLAAGPRELTVSGTIPDFMNRWELYPLDGNFYTKGDSGNVIHRLTPPTGDPITGTWTISTFTVNGNLPSTAGGGPRHYTRFFYVPSLECFAWIASATSPVFLIRPP